jgi:hypothetical protein
MSRHSVVHNLVPLTFMCGVLLLTVSLVAVGEPVNRRPPDLLGAWSGVYQLEGTDFGGGLYSRIDTQDNRRFSGVMGLTANALFNAINFNIAGTLPADGSIHATGFDQKGAASIVLGGSLLSSTQEGLMIDFDFMMIPMGGPPVQGHGTVVREDLLSRTQAPTDLICSRLTTSSMVALRNGTSGTLDTLYRPPQRSASLIPAR